MDELQSQIETRIADLDPAIEVLDVQRIGREDLRIFIDHPDGVTLDHCEAATFQLRDLLVDYGLEVSSPGLERPFFSPEQMQGYIGQTVRIRLEKPLEGRKNFKGSLLAVAPPMFTLTDSGSTFELNWEDVAKANLVYEHHDQGKPGKR